MDGRSTPEARARTAANNAIYKRKYPVEFGARSRLHRIWKSMHFRCYYPSHEAYNRYGGMGINICSAWSDYGVFLNWALANGYKPELTIDRIDNEKGYSPENCRWTTMKQQQQNRRSNLPPLAAFGEAKSLIDWSDDARCMVDYRILWRRIKAGWDAELAITTRPLSYGVKRTLL